MDAQPLRNCLEGLAVVEKQKVHLVHDSEVTLSFDQVLSLRFNIESPVALVAGS